MTNEQIYGQVPKSAFEEARDAIAFGDSVAIIRKHDRRWQQPDALNLFAVEVEVTGTTTVYVAAPTAKDAEKLVNDEYDWCDVNLDGSVESVRAEAQNFSPELTWECEDE